jgi:hypothetical protein
MTWISSKSISRKKLLALTLYAEFDIENSKLVSTQKSFIFEHETRWSFIEYKNLLIEVQTNFLKKYSSRTTNDLFPNIL